jgi:hypothetical protein
MDEIPFTFGNGGAKPVARLAQRYAKLLSIRQATIEDDLEKNYVFQRLWLYDHSGITMSTGAFSCPWDSGEVGFIYCSMETARKEWGFGDASDEEIRARAEKYLEGEVETYDAYISGQVYGYRIVETFGEDEDEDEGGEELDSCWGFFGLDYCREEARSSAEYYASKIPVQLALELTD